jgi:serine protease AprX
MQRNGTVAGAGRARRPGRRVAPGLGVALVAAAALGLTAPSQAATAGPGTTGAVGAPGSYIVRATPGHLAELTRLLAAQGVAVRERINLIDAVVADLPAGAAARLRGTSGVASVSRNEAVSMMALAPLPPSQSPPTFNAATDAGSLYTVETLTGVRNWWSKYTGAGIDVALVDSGVAPVNGLDAAGKVVNGPDLTPESQNTGTATLDTSGHGTHMAGIIAGRDALATPATGATDTENFMGVAPDARIVSVKVADARGNSDVSQVIAGISWVVEHAKAPGMNIRVLNLSFGTNGTQVYTADPLTYAVEVAWRKGIVVVASGGNGGGQNNGDRLTNPAADPFVLAVAADDLKGTASLSDDVIAPFSSRGDGKRNPDLSAPGVHLQSLRVPGSYVDASYGSGGKINERFFRGSGTSQAAAFVSGAVALLLQKYPSLTPDQVKAMLLASSTKLTTTTTTAQGAGLLDLNKLAAGSVRTATQTFSPGIGNGSIHAARGNAILSLDGVALTGENDIFGLHYDSVAMAPLLASGKSWTGGTFNGTNWTGTAWNSTGTTWGTTSWTGRSWAGRSWAGRTWASGTWTGSAWTGGNWAGSTWSGATWAASTWTGRTWADNEWK